LGSIDKKILKKNKGNIVDSMVESALENVKLLESLKFNNFKISAKASSVLDTVNAYEAISDKVDYPLHLGVTEAGPLMRGSIKSAVGMGILLSEGIGDTIRVSLTDKSVEEVKAAFMILNSLKLRKKGVDIISCPTCGRTTIDLNKMVYEVERLTAGIRKNLKLALMGCIVNGPGEAKDADLGIAFGRKKAAVFLKGKVLKRVDKDAALKVFEKELEKLI
jgi:(E)-4-hydroxy-3-methylbut-2-enyl-diphosphate synthase